MLCRALAAVRRGDSNAVGAALAVAPALGGRLERGRATLLGVAVGAVTTDHADGPTTSPARRIDVVRLLIDAGDDPSVPPA